jgi:methylenetetrahydrofolate reductase (NADPH)
MSRALRPLFVTVTWGASGTTSSKSLELAELCQRQLGLTTCLHLTCTNMSRALIDKALEEAKVLGVRNILCLRGDPPRSEEYWPEGLNRADDSNREFNHAIDLVRYVRRTYGDWFCIGVAAYPEGHSDESHPDPASQDPKKDLPFLVQKVEAGADFIMTQLFYDVAAYRTWEAMVRREGGKMAHVTIIPGLMPVQSYQILRRITKLSHAKLPPAILRRFDAVKGDDELVKQVGVDVISEIIEQLRAAMDHTGLPRGFHFYTLNLEKSVAHILEKCKLIPPITPDEDDEGPDSALQIVDSFQPPESLQRSRERRRLSSINGSPHNRVVVSSSRPTKSSNASYEAREDEVGVPRDKINSRANTLAISEGEGSLGREATWDDFPNGRWGDARSPGKLLWQFLLHHAFFFNPKSLTYPKHLVKSTGTESRCMSRKRKPSNTGAIPSQYQTSLLYFEDISLANSKQTHGVKKG